MAKSNNRNENYREPVSANDNIDCTLYTFYTGQLGKDGDKTILSHETYGDISSNILGPGVIIRAYDNKNVEIEK